MGNSTRADEEASRTVDEVTQRLVRKAMRSLGWILPTTGEAARLAEEGLRADAGGAPGAGDHESWPTVLRETPESVAARPPKPALVTTTPLSLVSSKPTSSFAFMSFKRLGDESETLIHLDPAECVAARFGAAGLGVVRPYSTSRLFTALGDPSEAGRWMNVDYVFDGSVARTGSRLRVTARLVRVSDGMPLWERTCEGDQGDLVAFDNSLAEQVGLIFLPHPTPAQRKRFVRRPTDSADAYLQYKLGRDRFNRFDEEGLNDAITFFRRAAALDPNFAEAHASAGETLIWQTLLGLHSPGRGPARLFDEARLCTERALALNPALANAQTSEAFIKMCVEADLAEAERCFRRALENDANYVLAYVGLACWLTAHARFDEALVKIEEALTIDPSSFICHFIKGTILYEARDFARAARQFEDTLRLHDLLVEQFRGTSETLPPPDAIFYGLALAYATLGRYKEAADAAKRATRYARGNPIKLALRAYVLAAAGRLDEAKTLLKQLLKAGQEDFIPFHIALIYVALGDNDEADRGQHKAEALRCLRSAREKCDYWMFLLLVDPRLDSLRSDPDFVTQLN